MAANVIMPKQGVSMVEGTIAQWYVKEGDAVHPGDILASVETEKFINDLESRAEGVVARILVQEGETVPVATVLAIVAEPGEDPASICAAMKPDESAPSGAAIPEAAGPSALGHAAGGAGGGTPSGAAIPEAIESSALGRIMAAPRARALAAEIGVRLQDVRGTGKDGMITEHDVREHAAAAARGAQSAREEPCPPADELVRMSPVRRAIAQNMMRSVQGSAQARHVARVDMGEAIRQREALKRRGLRVSFSDIVIHAAARALSEYPMMNAQIRGDDIVLRRGISVGLAVTTERDELFVPVLRGADSMELAEIAGRTRELIARAREGRLSGEDCGGGSFTVSNLGMFGLDEFTAILNPPETGILAVGRIADAPVARDGAVVIRPMMALTLTYDHRVVDGAYSAKFLMRIAELLQAPSNID